MTSIFFKWVVQPPTSTLPKTNSLHLKMDGWNTTYLLGWPIFRGENVSFREAMTSLDHGVEMFRSEEDAVFHGTGRYTYMKTHQKSKNI